MNFFRKTRRSLLGIMVAAAFMFAAMFSFPGEAYAAKSGGRVGGRAFSSRAAAKNSSFGSGSRPENSMFGGRIYRRGPTILFGGGFHPFGMFGSPFMNFGMFGVGPFGFGYNPTLSLGLTFADVLI